MLRPTEVFVLGGLAQWNEKDLCERIRIGLTMI